MTLRDVLLRLAAPVVFIAAGVAVAATVDSPLGTGIAGFLIGVGFVIAVSIVFYEIGRSEDRDRAREEEERRST
jgi:ABC-type transport system involved in cytochrome bd biosynthesis fused ATPase/permease subunit